MRPWCEGLTVQRRAASIEVARERSSHCAAGTVGCVVEGCEEIDIPIFNEHGARGPQANLNSAGLVVVAARAVEIDDPDGRAKNARGKAAEAECQAALDL